MKKRYEFKKNDFVLLLIIGAIILLVDYSLNWYQVYKEHSLSTAIISKYITEVSKEEFETYIEENPNAFVYFGVIDDEVSREFENRFKKTITKYHLKDNIIYLNVKDVDFESLFNRYKDNEITDISTPMVAYYENKKIIDLINYDNSDLSEKKVIRLFRKYGEID